jgi:hypothetical protein
MASFYCDKCGHQQDAAASKIGRRVACPKCGEVGGVTPTPPPTVPPLSPSVSEPEREAAHVPTVRDIRGPSMARRLMPQMVCAATLLLACSVVLQAVILAHLARPGTLNVSISDGRALPVKFGDVVMPVAVQGSVPVEVGNILPISVEIDSASTIPVEVQNDEVSVSIDRHYIGSGRPIPVVIENDPLPVEVKNEPLSVEEF